MKLHKFLSIGLASAGLASASQAQQFFGPWVHDVSAPLSIFVDDFGGNDANSGLDPANAVQTLAQAVFLADVYQVAVGTPVGATINVIPGTYTLSGSLSLPAFGLAIEPYFDGAGGTVIVNGSASNSGLFDYDHLVSAGIAEKFGLPDTLPPSVVRGITFTGNDGGFAVEIDPSQNGSSDETDRPIEVQVNQCTMSQCDRGVMIRNLNSLELTYHNQIINNRIGSCDIGIEAVSGWFHSDLIRSNHVQASFFAGMRFNGSGTDAGMLHPRVLSNTVTLTLGNIALTGTAVVLQDCSARVVNNTLGFARTINFTPATIEIFPDSGGSAAETIVISNNILCSQEYNPAGAGVISPPEIRLPASPAYLGALTVESNDVDNLNGGLFFSPAAPPQTVFSGNLFVSNFFFLAPPANLQLTAASPSVTSLGLQSRVLPGAGASITLNGQSVPAHHALDVDLDARTQMRVLDFSDVLHRGSDQFLESGQRLRTATTGANPLALADRFGNLPVDGAGNASVDLLLDLPVGSVFALMWGAALPMGPELQHLVLSPFGSFAVDPTGGNGVLLPAVVTTLNPEPFSLPLGTFVPSFTEAEQFLQALILLPNGVTTFTNRLRIDVDAI